MCENMDISLIFYIRQQFYNFYIFQTNPFTYNAYESVDFENGKELKITAILRLKEDVSYGSLNSGIYYTTALAREIIADSLQSEIVRYLNETEQSSFNSVSYNGNNVGITYTYSFEFEGTIYEDQTGFVGSQSQTNAFIGSVTGQELPNYYTLTLREIGGCELPNQIKIYPTDFDYKDNVTSFLNEWNSDKDISVSGKVIPASERSKIEYTDNLEIVISMINSLINIVTSALVAFTALSLVVSTVMVAIITYVSVMERVKEIGVIRSLGGRKRDV